MTEKAHVRHLYNFYECIKTYQCHSKVSDQIVIETWCMTVKEMIWVSVSVDNQV